MQSQWPSLYLHTLCIKTATITQMCVPSTGPHLMACNEGKRAQPQCCVEVEPWHGESSKQACLRVWGWLGPEERVDRTGAYRIQVSLKRNIRALKSNTQKQWHPYLSSQRSYRSTRGRQKNPRSFQASERRVSSR